MKLVLLGPGPVRDSAGESRLRPERYSFLKAFVKAPGVLGTCFVSSRVLSAAMVHGIGLEGARAVVEFGAGTGPITAAILARIPPGARFIAIEWTPALAELLRHRFSGVTVRCGDAAEAAAMCREEGVAPGTVDAVVSSLPFLLLPAQKQGELLDAAAGIMRRGACFTTITYRPEGVLPGVRAFRRRMEERFSRVELSQVVLANFPPAFVYRAWK